MTSNWSYKFALARNNHKLKMAVIILLSFNLAISTYFAPLLSKCLIAMEQAMQIQDLCLFALLLGGVYIIVTEAFIRTKVYIRTKAYINYTSRSKLEFLKWQTKKQTKSLYIS